MKPFPMTIGARRISAIAREQYAHVHLVGLGFEPAEVTFDTVPGTRPFVFLVLAVTRLSVDDKVLPFFREPVKGDIRRDLEMTTRSHQISLALGAHAAQPGFNDALGKGPGAIRDCQIIVDADDSAKSAAFWTGPYRVIKAKEGRGGFTIFDVAIGAMKAIGEA